MILRSYLLLMGIAVATTTNEGVAVDPQILNRLNYGVYAVQTGRVDIVHSFWTAVVHVQLPNVTQLQLLDCHNDFFGVTNSSRDNCSRTVDQMFGLWNKINTVLLEHTREIEITIPQSHYRANRALRQPRGLFDFVGTATSYLFGVATEADLQGLRRELLALRRSSAGMADDTLRVRDEFSHFVTLENQRLSNLDNALMYQQDQITGLEEEIAQTLLNGVSNTRRIELLEQTLDHFITIYDHMLTLSTGLDALVQGHLSPKLIPWSLMEELWFNISRSVRDKGLYTVSGSPQLMYSLPSFDFARDYNNIIIRLKIPLTNKPNMRVFRLYSLPLMTPGDQGLMSQVKHLPQQIVYNHDRRILGTINNIPDHNLVLNSQVTWHTRDSSCILAILTDQIDRVKTQCYFELTRDQVRPEIQQLSETMYILTNFTNVGTYCKTRMPPNSEMAQCKPCLLETSCNCIITATNPENNEVVTIEAPECPSASTTSDAGTLHPINLVVLQTFYNDSTSVVSSQSLFRPNATKSMQPLRLKLLADKTKRLLATNQHLNYSLQRVAQQLAKNMNDTIIGSISEAVLLDYFDQLENPNNFRVDRWIDWSVCALYVLVIILMFLHYRSRQILTKMTTPLVTQMLPLKARAYDIVVPILNTSPSTSLSDNELPVSNYLSTELYALLLYIFVFLLLIYFMAKCFLFGYYLFDQMKSDLALIFETSETSVYVKWMTLPDSNRNYEVTIPHMITPRIYNCYFFGVLKIDTSPWRIFNTLTGRTIKAPRWIIVSASNMNRLKHNILPHHYTVSMAVVHSHHIEPLRSRNRMGGTEQTTSL